DRGARGRHPRGADGVRDRARRRRQQGHADGRRGAAAAGGGRGKGARRARPERAARAAGAGGHSMSGAMRWDTDLAEVPARYQEFMVPGMFGVLAEAVADAAEPMPGDRALDLACGTGALTRIMAGRVGPSGAVTGLDLSDGMLAVARSLEAPGAAPIEYVQGS